MLETFVVAPEENEENWWKTKEEILEALGDILIDEDVELIELGMRADEAMTYVRKVLPDYLPLPGYTNSEALLSARGLISWFGT